MTMTMKKIYCQQKQAIHIYITIQFDIHNNAGKGGKKLRAYGPQ